MTTPRAPLPILLSAILAWGCQQEVSSFGEDEDTATDSSVDTSGDVPVDVPFDARPDTAADTPIDTATDTTTDTPIDTATDTATDTPIDTATDTSVDTATDTSEEEPVDMRDTDGDTIRDVDEGDGAVDTDDDGTPDSADLDSDDDGLTDTEEAGDNDLMTPPTDCESDGIPDFRDLDSDDDGLTDTEEDELGTDPCTADSDGDGVSDLSEVAYGSDPLDGTDNPTAYGDFVFEMPYGGSPSPVTDTLVFSTDIQVADVYFLLDQTCSLTDEIASLIGSLHSTIIPGIQDEVDDVWFGVGAFQDCAGGSMFPCPNEMANLQSMTSETDAVSDALDIVAADCCGGDEPYYHALYAVATGDLAPFSAWNVHPTSWSCTPPGSIGWPCFRELAVPIVIQLGDEDLDDAGASCAPVHTTETAVDALNAIDAHYIGLDAGNSFDDMVRVATGTGSVDMSGTPLVFDVSGGTGIGTQVVEAVSQLVTNVPIRVDAVAHDDPSDFVDAVAEFIDSIHTNTSGDPIYDPILDDWRVCTSGIPVGTPGTPPTDDYFETVEPGDSVCFDIEPATNTSVTATSVPLVFHATIEVIGDLHTPLDVRQVVFVVPPDISGG